MVSGGFTIRMKKMLEKKTVNSLSLFGFLNYQLKNGPFFAEFSQFF